MDYSAVSQTAKRFEQKSEVNNEIKEYMQKVITALKEIWMSNVETWPHFIVFLKKKDFLKPFVELILRYRKIEKTNFVSR